MRSDSRARSTFSALAAAAVVCARLDMVLRATSSYRCSLPMPTRHARQDGQGFEGCRSSRLPLVSDTNFRLDFLASRDRLARSLLPRLHLQDPPASRPRPSTLPSRNSRFLKFRLDVEVIDVRFLIPAASSPSRTQWRSLAGRWRGMLTGPVSLDPASRFRGVSYYRLVALPSPARLAGRCVGLRLGCLLSTIPCSASSSSRLWIQLPRMV
ncbi:hypothetical protein BJY59DRAFT_686543 [Rhodotorula toruloides]